jgi:REP element-mobilizing transposase RayT
VALTQSDSGPHWLKESELADQVAESVHYRDGKVYDLMAFCVMPNHLHLVFTPLVDARGKPNSIVKIMQSLKGYTAHECNQLLGREGAFWQHESFDHWARDAAERKRIIRYVMMNPVRAGLVESWDDWPWTYIREL